MKLRNRKYPKQAGAHYAGRADEQRTNNGKAQSLGSRHQCRQRWQVCILIERRVVKRARGWVSKPRVNSMSHGANQLHVQNSVKPELNSLMGMPK